MSQKIDASKVVVQPFHLFELLFFALFGFTGAEDLIISSNLLQSWTLFAFKLVFASYLLLSNVVLVNLLIAMMSDTYQRIQQQSDIEWKYGLAKLIRNMQRTQVLNQNRRRQITAIFRSFLGCSFALEFTDDLVSFASFLVSIVF